MIKLNKQRTYALYVYNSIAEYERVNTLYETIEEINKDIEELRTEGTYLFNKYSKKFKYFVIIDTSASQFQCTIKEIILECITKDMVDKIL